MVNKEHQDYQKYKTEFEELVKKQNIEISKVKPRKYKGFDGEECIIHKKYALKIKALQEKYKYLFASD